MTAEIDNEIVDQEDRILEECQKKDINDLLAKLAKAYVKYEKLLGTGEFYKAGQETYAEAQHLVYFYDPFRAWMKVMPNFWIKDTTISTPEPKPIKRVPATKKIKELDETKLKVSIFLATEVLNRPDDLEAIRRLEKNVNENRPPHWKPLLAKLAKLVGLAICGLSAVIACLPDPTGGFVSFGAMAFFGLGLLFIGVGAAFSCQYQKQNAIPARLSELAGIAKKHNVFSQQQQSSTNPVEKPTEEALEHHLKLAHA